MNKEDSELKHTRICVVINNEKSDMQLNSFARKCGVPIGEVLEAFKKGVTGQAMVNKFYNPLNTAVQAKNKFLYNR